MRYPRLSRRRPPLPDLWLERYHTGDTQNWGRFSDPKQLVSRQQRTLDPVERKTLVFEIKKIMLENAYIAPGPWWTRIMVHRAKVKNHVAPPNYYSDQRLQDVWLSEDRSMPILMRVRAAW